MHAATIVSRCSYYSRAATIRGAASIQINTVNTIGGSPNSHVVKFSVYIDLGHVQVHKSDNTGNIVKREGEGHLWLTSFITSPLHLKHCL